MSTIYIVLISYSHIIFVNLIEFESESSISSNKWPPCPRCPSPLCWSRLEKPGSEPFNQLAKLKIEPVPPASRGEGAGAINAFPIIPNLPPVTFSFSLYRPRSCCNIEIVILVRHTYIHPFILNPSSRMMGLQVNWDWDRHVFSLSQTCDPTVLFTLIFMNGMMFGGHQCRGRLNPGFAQFSSRSPNDLLSVITPHASASFLINCGNGTPAPEWWAGWRRH